MTLPQADTLPSLFLSHGAPDLPLSDTRARGFTEAVGARYPQLRGIVVISAHWEAAKPTIGTAAAPETVYDFGGFDPRLYKMTYPAKTSAAVIAALREVLGDAGVDFAEDARRGYDHGVWVPLGLAFPGAEVPVVQLSLTRGASAAQNYALGQALAPLRARGILVVGSGATVHNLRAIAYEGTPPADWARAFDNWIAGGVAAGDVAGLTAFPNGAPQARMAHPTPEHLMPLYVAFGAGGGKGRALHRSFSYGNLGMSCFEFGA